jgi:hypothetical protein
MSIADRTNLDAARNFQKRLLNSFPDRADAILQLIEASASAEKPTSVVDLSLEAPFQTSYSNVHKAIHALSKPLLGPSCLDSSKPIDTNGMHPAEEGLDPGHFH